jgi:hypothetical protein
MVAAFGTGKISFHRPLVSETPRLTLRSLPGFGKFIDLRWQGAAAASLTRVSRTGAEILLETAGTLTRVGLREWPMPRQRGRDHGIRERFACPRCDASRDALHWLAEVGWGCRGCLGLDFACRHQQRWCPAIRRRARLLRKLARCSPKGLKARRLRGQIAHQEAAMLANLKRANRDLTKRRRRHVRHGRVDPSQ